MEDLIQRALDTATSRGAAYADVRVERKQVESIAVKNGNVEAMSDSEESGFGVRVLIEGAWGFASSNEMSPGEADRVAALAVEIARASLLASPGPARLGEPVTSVGSHRNALQIDPFSVPTGEKVALLLAADEAMRRVRGITVTEAGFHAQRILKRFASTEGSQIEQELVETGAGLEATAVGDGEIQKRSYPNSFGRHQATAGYEFVTAMGLAEHGQELAEQAVALLTAPQCSSQVATVILDPTQMALQVHESCGHPIELDRVLGMEASYAGTSFLTLEKRGAFRYGSEVVNLVADATVPGGLGTFGYDDEGVPSQRTDVVRNGVFVGYLTSRETAATIGERSGGAMRADGWNRIPLIRMTNINLEPGPWTLEALIQDTQDGIYMQTNKSWSIDDKRLNFQFGAEIAWEIKRGKLARMLRNATYTGITPRFWGSCDAVCREWQMWGVVNCGKGQPSQSAHVGHGTAAARFRNVQVGVKG